MPILTLFLDWPPTVNNYYAHTKRGVYLSAKGRKYSHSVELDVQEQAPDIYITETVLMEVHLFPPDRRRRDLDNYMKALQDSLVKAGLIEDDSLIDQLFIYRGEVVKGGLVLVEITDSGPISPLPGSKPDLNRIEGG